MKIYKDGVLIEDTKQPRDKKGRWSGWSKRRVVKMLKSVAWYVGIRAAVVVIAFGGIVAFAQYQIAAADPKVEYVQIEKIVEDMTLPPVMTRIAKCESGGKQFYSDGRLVRGKVNPADVGYFQVNEVIHYDAAKKLGMDIMTEEGNIAFARHLYETMGTAPWQSSSKCWLK